MQNKKIKTLLTTSMLILAMSTALIGCGKKEEAEIAPAEEQQETTTEETAETEDTAAAAAELDGTELYTLLSKCSFYYSSGAGGWYSEISVAEDGTFTGHYQDSDMGVISEEAPYGTIYNCDFKGTFANLTKVDDLTYRVTLDNVELSGSEGIIDGTEYVHSTPAGINETETLLIKLAGTTLDSLNEEELIWIMPSENQKQLTSPIIVNESTNEVFVGNYEGEYSTYEDVLENYYALYGLNDIVGYAYQDFDGDGNDELIIGDNSDNGEYGHAIYEMYTMVDGRVMNVLSSNAYETYYLVALTDDDPGSAFASLNGDADSFLLYKAYHFDGKRLVCDQAVRYSSYSDIPWMMGWETEDFEIEYSETIDEETGLAIVGTLENTKRKPNYTSLN